jgi:uncharacterized protein with beta-barrel porin domain
VTPFLHEGPKGASATSDAHDPSARFAHTPQRDSAVIGLQANTAIADGAQISFRYDGEFGGGSDNHAVTAGVHLSW